MTSKNFPSLKECPLCHQNQPLQESHIISKFIGKELKKSSGSQTFVDGINPQKNPKPQDTPKEFLLCGQCEQLFSKWETDFRNKVMPANQSLLIPINYGDWMLKFAVSISWRVLAYHKYARPYTEDEVTSKDLAKFFPALAPEGHGEAANALETWRSFLLGNRTNVIPFNQHFLVLNGKNFPHENCNFVGFTIFQDNDVIATNAFLGQFAILGFIRDSSRSIWKGTEINPTSGRIGIQQKIPVAYADWLVKLLAEIENVSVEDWKHKHSSST